MVNSKNLVYSRNCIGQTHFDSEINFTVTIWKQSAETDKTYGSWYDMVTLNKIFQLE